VYITKLKFNDVHFLLCQKIVKEKVYHMSIKVNLKKFYKLELR